MILRDRVEHVRHALLPRPLVLVNALVVSRPMPALRVGIPDRQIFSEQRVVGEMFPVRAAAQVERSGFCLADPLAVGVHPRAINARTTTDRKGNYRRSHTAHEWI